jgi:4-hydroxy-tetrahydrodipicolinate reductase
MAEPVRVVVSGATGRMGRTLATLATADAGLRLLGGIVRDADEAAPGVPGYPVLRGLAGAGDLLRSADALIDVSAPAFLRSLLAEQAESLAGRALVVGTTGLGPEEEALLAAAAERGPVLTAANFSVGVNLLVALAERAAGVLGEGYDVEIVEAHHRRKEDAPSGTALALAGAVAAARGVELERVRRDGRSGRPGARPVSEIGLHALRGGSIVGEHSVQFLGERDRIELVHRATDRALFAEGALRAARWLAGRAPGRYGMRDVLGLA